MKEVALINKLTNTIEFKRLKSLSLKIHDNQRQFDLLTVYQELIDEMAWSRLFAYLLDSTQPHDLKQDIFRMLLSQIPQLKTICKSLPSENITNTICITEWKTQKGRRIDILIKLIDIKGNVIAVIGIENKIDSEEQINQIRDYQKSLINEFPTKPKVLLYITPDGRLTQTADENFECFCFPVSFNVISSICENIIPNTTGQAKVFLSVLKAHIDKLTKNHSMNKEAIQLIQKLYRNRDYRQAIKLISEYSPNVSNVFDEIKSRLLKAKGLPFSPDNFSFGYYPTTSLNPHELKIHIKELSDLLRGKGFDPCYILRCETQKPDFEDIFTIRLAIWDANFKTKDSITRQSQVEKVQNLFSFPNSLGTNIKWSQWTCIWTGNCYKLTDMGDNDIEGLKKLLLTTIKDTYQEYQAGLKKLAKRRL